MLASHTLCRLGGHECQAYGGPMAPRTYGCVGSAPLGWHEIASADGRAPDHRPDLTVLIPADPP